MIKKRFFTVLFLMILIILSGCPDKDKSKSDESEQIPNTMEKAASELEQIITLLGGPMFDSRDKIEQLKNEQIQMLSAKTGENPEKSTTGSDAVQNQESGGDKKGEGDQEGQKQQGDQKSGAGGGEQQKEAGGEEKKDAGGEQQKESGGEEKKDAGDEQKKEEEKKDAGGEQQKEASGEEKKDTGDEQQKEAGGEEKKDAGGGEEQKSPESDQKISSKGGQKAQPSGGGQEEKPFQFEDSLFGIPQWNEENWKMIKVLTDGMYFTWNNLQPELLEKGVTEAQGESFVASLENLSKAVKDKNIGGAQISAFELYDKLSEFYSYFKTEKPPELQRVSSIVTGIHFAVRQNDWNMAQELSNGLQKEFTKVKANVQDNQSAIIKMLEISLDDLRSAVQKQDAILVLIRTNLVTANIEELDASLSQEQKE